MVSRATATPPLARSQSFQRPGSGGEGQAGRRFSPRRRAERVLEKRAPWSEPRSPVLVGGRAFLWNAGPRNWLASRKWIQPPNCHLQRGPGVASHRSAGPLPIRPFLSEGQSKARDHGCTGPGLCFSQYGPGHSWNLALSCRIGHAEASHQQRGSHACPTS
jgi:hypothetical protein